MNGRIFLAIFFSLTGFIIAHPHVEPPVDASQAERNALRNAKKVTITEGLPHPAKEPHLFPTEEKRRDTRKIAEFPFYKPDIKPDAARAARLKALLSDPKSFLEWKQKRCGGFHPDWSINWKSGRKSVNALVCFGCKDIMIVTADQQLRYGISPGAFKKLQAELLPLQSKRPRK